MNPTIKDVGLRANVSTATVSLVLSNHSRITQQTKKRVLKAIKELNYHPSRSAKGLVTRKTKNIGFILSDNHFLRTEPFYTNIFLGAEFVTKETDYYVLLTTIKNNFNEKDLLPRFILERSVDGVIIAGKVPSSFLQKMSQYKIPKILVDFYAPDFEADVIQIDNIRGGFLASTHLIEYGHRDIAFIGADINHPSISDRLIGYKQALERNKIRIKLSNIITDESFPGRANGYSAAQKLFARSKATAIFTCNDAMAIGVMHYCADHKIKIPHDISLVGFDDVEADLLVNPKLTTLRVPKIEMGVQAMNLMVEILKNPSQHTFKKILIPVELIIRGSTKRR